MPVSHLDQVIRAQKRGTTRGIYSICSAHPAVLRAAMRFAAGGPLLIESTSNQVNQSGGYTGMKARDFAALVRRIAAGTGFPSERIILGGDHLGPLPWSHEPAAEAMSKARVLVRECVQAGYTKIHLDASMRCADDGELTTDEIAERTVDLARVAEQAAAANLRYVVGSEVPSAGGALAGDAALRVTTPAAARGTMKAMREAFVKAGLARTWKRVIALVVQPGVEFGDESVHPYVRRDAAGLKRLIHSTPGVVYEAHSTDYQRREALRKMVEDGFAILKVGPALTFAYREAVFALEVMAEELGGPGGEGVSEALEAAMLAKPAYWQKYYRGTEGQLRLARRFSRADRIRYYWTDVRVSLAVERLFGCLQQRTIPQTLLSQYMPRQADRVRAGLLPNEAAALAEDHIQELLADYAAACA